MVVLYILSVCLFIVGAVLFLRAARFLVFEDIHNSYKEFVKEMEITTIFFVGGFFFLMITQIIKSLA